MNRPMDRRMQQQLKEEAATKAVVARDRRQPPPVDVTLREAVRCFLRGDVAMAARRLEALAARDEGALRPWLGLAHCQRLLGHHAAALAALERVDRLAPGLAEASWCRALVATAEGRELAALPLLESAFHTPVELEQGEFYLGLQFRSDRHFRGDVARRIAAIHRTRGDLATAQTWLEAALEECPDDKAIRRDNARLAFAQGRHGDAVSHLEVLLAAAANLAEAVEVRNQLAVAQYEAGNRDDAVEHLMWILRHAPGNPPAVHNLNQIYERESAYDREGAAEMVYLPERGGAGGLPIFGLDGTPAGASASELVVVGRSPAMMRVMRHARLAAASDSPVLLWGEPGTGKELVARLIATNSARRTEPFEVVHCTGLSDHDLEAEVFGYEKGAFAGARARTAGAIERAGRGTLFIDDLAALSPLMQGKLLRALGEGRFLPIGSRAAIAVLARVIAACVTDPRELVRTGRLREDLFFRLNVIPIAMPPLRDRREDIPLLAEHFLRRHGRHPDARTTRLQEEDMRLLVEYEWPGNVRELENLVERAIVLGSQSALYSEEMARLRRARPGRRTAPEVDETPREEPELSLAEVERRHILDVLRRCDNNQTRAARILGINPTTLWRKLKAYRDDDPDAV